VNGYREHVVFCVVTNCTYIRTLLFSQTLDVKSLCYLLDEYMPRYTQQG